MFFFFSSRRRHTRFDCDWSSGVLFRSSVGRFNSSTWVGSRVLPDGGHRFFLRCGSRILRAVQDVETRLITHYNSLCCREPFKKLAEPFLTWIDDLRKL